jgi:hypothetical protein
MTVDCRPSVVVRTLGATTTLAAAAAGGPHAFARARRVPGILPLGGAEMSSSSRLIAAIIVLLSGATVGGLLVGLPAPTPSTAHANDVSFIPPCARVPSNLVAWWQLDEISGQIAHDSWGDNHGTHQNGPIPLIGAHVRNSLVFDGSSQYVEIQDSTSLDVGDPSADDGGDFTIDAWLRLDGDASGVKTIVDKRTLGPTIGYALFTVNGVVHLQLADGAAPGDTCGSSPTANPCTMYNSGVSVADGGWHFVAASVSRSGPSFFSIDGVAVPFDASSRQGSFSNSAPLLIGRHATSGGYWPGALDEIEIFNRALAEEELLSILGSGFVGKCPCTPMPGNLVAWWNFDELAGSLAVERIGGSDGTHVNNPLPQAGQHVRNSVHLDGTSFVHVDPAPNLDLGDTSQPNLGDFSIDVWVRLDSSATGIQTIVDKRTFDPATGFALFTVDGVVHLQLADGSAPGNTCGTNPALNPCTTYNSGVNIGDGLWHFVGVSVDRDGVAAFWIDGGLEIPFDASVRSGSLKNTAPLKIGQHALGAGGAWIGDIDELEFFDRALLVSGPGSLHGEFRPIWEAATMGKCTECLVGDDFDDDAAPGFPNLFDWTVTNASCSLQPGGPSGSGFNAVCGNATGPALLRAPQRYVNQLFASNEGCLSLCYDVYVADDGVAGSSPSFPATFFISSSANPLNPISAQFLGPQVSEPGGSNPGWHRVCAPIFMVATGDPLPSSPAGSWSIVSGSGGFYYDDWNTLLLGTAQEITFPVNLGSDSATEVVHYDSFCVLECKIPEAGPCPTVCGRKFFDANRDGAYQTTEATIPNWTIELYDPIAGVVVDQQTTDEFGRYCFSLPKSATVQTYVVREVVESGWTQTYPGAPGTYEVHWKCGYPGHDSQYEICRLADQWCNINGNQLDFGNWRDTSTWIVHIPQILNRSTFAPRPPNGTRVPPSSTVEASPPPSQTATPGVPGMPGDLWGASPLPTWRR